MIRITRNKRIFTTCLAAIAILTFAAGCSSSKGPQDGGSTSADQAEVVGEEQEASQQSAEEEAEAANDAALAAWQEKIAAASTQADWQALIDETMPGFDCWGDSITEGFLGDGVTYPATLAGLMEERLFDPIRESSGFSGLTAPPVRNMGVCTETTAEITGRRGAVPFSVMEAFEIPADQTPVDFWFWSSDHGQVTKPLRHGDGTYGGNGINPVTIAGVEGELIRYFDVEMDSSRYQFKRAKAGEPVSVNPGEYVFTDASGKYGEDFAVVLMGANGGYEDPANLVDHFGRMAGMQKNEHYLLLGMGHRPEDNGRLSKEETESLSETFGDHFISLQEWMAENGIEYANRYIEAGITPTAEDEKRMEQGITPASLLNEDDLHYTPVGYQVIAYLVYDEMDARGYFDDLKALAGNK